MSTKHTPGPWYQHDEKGRRFIETIDGEVICTMSSRPMKPANGLLVAAAPDLLDALQMAKHIVANEGTDEQMAQVFAAIEKATGEPA